MKTIEETHFECQRCDVMTPLDEIVLIGTDMEVCVQCAKYLEKEALESYSGGE